MSIKTYQYLGACISVVIIVVIAAVFFVASQRVNRALDRGAFASEIVIGISELRFVTLEYILYHHERPRLQWQQRYDSVAKPLASGIFEGTDQQRIVYVLRQRHQDLKEGFSRLAQHYTLGGNGNDPAEIALSRELEARLVGQLEAMSQEMIAAAFRLMRESESDIANTQRRVNMLITLAITVMGFIVVANMVLGIRYVLQPISRLQRGIEIIGDGDLNYRTGITSTNEIGALSQAFDRMTARVQESRAVLETERLRTARHEAIRESEARYRGIVESVMEGIISVDEQQRIVLFNPGAERIFGRPTAAMIGEPLSILIPERFRTQHGEHFHKFAMTGETSRAMGQYGMIYGLRPDGTEFPVEATISRMETGRNRLFTVILRDLTERLRTEQALRDLTEQLRRLSRQLLETEENERRRLSRELHDRVGQNVTALTLNLNMLRSGLPAEFLQKVGEQINHCETLLYSTGQLIRDVMAELRPPGLDQLGLLAALTEHARWLSSQSGLSVTVSGTEIVPRPPPQSEIMLYRIAQEALMNVVKHARATEVTVALEASPDRIVMTVSDNGCGFEPAARLARVEVTVSLGVVGMRERAEAIGGRLRVESAPGRGTRVIVEAPRVPLTPWPPQRVPRTAPA